MWKAAEYTYTIFVEDRQANSSRGVDIRVEEALRKFTLWWFARVVFTKVDCDRIETTFPVSLQPLYAISVQCHQITENIVIIFYT